jgi:20S proteasome subunit alpha 5
MALNFG